MSHLATPVWAALTLGVLGLILVGPGPLWVVRWSFLYRVPRAAVVLWQAGALAGLISVVGAGLVLALPLLAAPGAVAQLTGLEQLWFGFLLFFSVVVVARLCWSLVAVAQATRTRRQRHLAAVDLLGQVDPSLPLPGLRILAESMPVAYCLPSAGGSRVVLSDGTLSTLARDEVTAVLEHESAHVRARHDVVLDTFTALHQAFPLIVRSAIPAEQCRLLVEMLADDAACRRCGPAPLARALVALADAPVPLAGLAATRYGTVERVERLADPVGYSRPLSLAVYGLAAALLAAPLVILLAPWLFLEAGLAIG
jgi:Zn-dependent protease with chaperone function